MEEWFVVLVRWANSVVVPALLIAVIYIADTVTRRAAEGSEYRLSVRAGWWGGLLAFVLFANFLSYVREIDVSDISRVAALWALPTTLILGFYLVHLIKAAIPTRYGGFAVMLMVFAGAATLITFVAINNQGLRAIISWATFGLAFGILIHAVVNPGSITTFYPHPDQNPFKDVRKTLFTK